MRGEAENLESIRQGYEALERDDVDGFLGMCAPDVEWCYPAQGRLAYGGTWRGREGIAKFLAAHDAAEEIVDLRLDELLTQGDRVVVVGRFRGRARPSRRPWETRFVHCITLNNGLWQRFEAYFDTAAAVDAHSG